MKKKLELAWDPESAPSSWINHASRLLMRQSEEELRPLGFGMAYLPVVMALKEQGALTQKALAALAHVEQPTMAALLIRMERDGVVTRAANPGDKRSSVVALTAKAKARVPQAQEKLAEISSRVTAGFSERDRRAFLGFLRRAVENLSPAEDDAR